MDHTDGDTLQRTVAAALHVWVVEPLALVARAVEVGSAGAGTADNPVARVKHEARGQIDAQIHDVADTSSEDALKNHRAAEEGAAKRAVRVQIDEPGVSKRACDRTPHTELARSLEDRREEAGSHGDHTEAAGRVLQEDTRGAACGESRGSDGDGAGGGAYGA